MSLEADHLELEALFAHFSRVCVMGDDPGLARLSPALAAPDRARILANMKKLSWQRKLRSRS